MAIFQTAFDNIIKLPLQPEVVPHPIYEHQYGLSKRFLECLGLGNKYPLSSLNQELAEDIYFNNFWLKEGYHNLLSQNLANKMLKCCGQFTSNLANLFLQRSINIYLKHNTDLHKILEINSLNGLFLVCENSKLDERCFKLANQLFKLEKDMELLNVFLEEEKSYLVQIKSSKQT
ncbi:hypothetical protein ABSA28_00476 [Candidatus Hepatincolaceae symbiont of Richtersius coronifer]